MENAIDGYRELDAETLETINNIKSLEREVASQWRLLVSGDDADKRELALARTHFEDAFMHFVKAVANPVSPW
jgi:beta-phosphoglucomutase-like phosphatase (HAD superfamily)